jgi:ketosteroid isomerase-like protein
MTRIARLLSVLGLLALSSSACSSSAAAPPAPAGPSADDLVAIRKMDSEFGNLILARDWPSLTKFFADKAVLMPPGARTVMGAAAISEWFASASGTVHEFTTNVEAIGGSGNLAINRGRYRLVHSPVGATGPITEPGKYLWVLQRQPDNSWRITAATWNADVPPPTK